MVGESVASRSRARWHGRLLAFGASLVCAAVSAQDIRVASIQTPAPGIVTVAIDGAQIAKTQASNYSLQFVGSDPVKAAELNASAPAPQAASLVIAIDKSGSMGQPTIKAMKTALDGFVAQAKPGLSIGIIGFGSATQTLVPFGTDLKTTRARLRDLAVESRDSKTKLYEAISGGLDQLNAVDAGGTRRMLVISDGKDEGSDTGIERIVDKAHANHVVIDAVGAGRLAAASSSSLVSISDRTGGRFFLAKPGEEGIAAALAEILGGYASPRQAAILTFKYEPAADGSKTERAILVFAPASGAPVRSELQGGFSIPGKAGAGSRPTAEPPVTARPETTSKSVVELIVEFKFPIIAIAVLLAVALLLWFLVMTRKREAPQPVPTTVEPLPRSTTGSPTPTRPAQGRMTRVARYAFMPPEAGRAVAILRGISGPIGVRQVPILTSEFRIGADGDNDLSLGGDDVLSSRHALIRYDSGSLYLSDRQSRNGTFLNGARLTEVPMPLSLGDELRFGKSTMVLEAPASGASAMRGEGAIA